MDQNDYEICMENHDFENDEFVGFQNRTVAAYFCMVVWETRVLAKTNMVLHADFIVVFGYLIFWCKL